MASSWTLKSKQIDASQVANPFPVGLVIGNNATHADHKVDVTFTSCNVQGLWATAGTYTIDIEVSGPLGLDTGSETDGWYFIYAIVKEDKTTSGILSTSAVSPSFANASGYTRYRLLGAVRSISGSFKVFKQVGNCIVNKASGNNTITPTPQSSATVVAHSIVNYVPTTICSQYVAWLSGNADGAFTIFAGSFATVGGDYSTMYDPQLGYVSGGYDGIGFICLNIDNNIYHYRFSGSGTYAISILKYWINI